MGITTGRWATPHLADNRIDTDDANVGTLKWSESMDENTEAQSGGCLKVVFWIAVGIWIMVGLVVGCA